MSKIVVLEGSPRKGGNTQQLADALVKGAREAGNEVQRFSVAERTIHGCLGCDYCRRNEGDCIQKDGMEEIYAALRQADTLVFASPTYYFGFSAQLKAIIDRFYACHKKPFTVRAAALLMVLGGDAAVDLTAGIVNYESLVSYCKWEDKGRVIVDHVLDKGDIAGHAALKEAEDLGRTL